jgi:hypothetical protein
MQTLDRPLGADADYRFALIGEQGTLLYEGSQYVVFIHPLTTVEDQPLGVKVKIVAGAPLGDS